MIKAPKGITQKKVLVSSKIVKRCPHCTKTFKAQFYDDHIANCPPKKQLKNVSHLLDPNPEKRSQLLEVDLRKTKYKSEKKDGGNKNGRIRGSSFRIKNTPKVVDKIQKEIKNQIADASFRESVYIEEKKQEKYQHEEKQQKKQEEVKVEQTLKKKQQKKKEQRPTQRIEQPRQRQPIQINPPQTFPDPPQPTVQNTQTQTTNLNPLPPVPSLMNPRIGQNYDIQALVHNTNSIISFVSFLNQRIQHPIFTIMIDQLSQLNTITDTVAELNNSRFSPYNMANVFAERVNQIQVTIVNRIGGIINHIFAQSYGRDFQRFISNQPQFKTGFDQQQLQDLFPEALCSKESECPICLEQIKKYSMLIELQCYHSFHPTCIRQWLKSNKKCPMCRQQQTKN